MTRLPFALLLLLGGCATSEPAVRVETVTVKVPVVQPCVDRATIPAEPARIGDKLVDDAHVNESLLAGSAGRLRLWGEKMFDMLVACSTVPPLPAGQPSGIVQPSPN